MAEKADPAGGAGKAGVLLDDGFVLDIVEVSINDHLAVEGHFNMAAVGHDLFFVPLASRLGRIDIGLVKLIEPAGLLRIFGGAGVVLFRGGTCPAGQVPSR